MPDLAWGANGRASVPGYTAEVRRSTLGPLWLGIVRSPGLYASTGHTTEDAARRWCADTINLFGAGTRTGGSHGTREYQV